MPMQLRLKTKITLIMAALVLAVAGADALLAAAQAAMSGPSLRIYTTDDVVGAEIGGCLKNVYAIAAGCANVVKPASATP